MRKLFFALMLIMLINGCSNANHEHIIQQAEKVDVSDGVDKQEAVLLAQKTMIEREWSKQCDVENILTTRHADGEIKVEFPRKFSFTRIFSKDRYSVIIVIDEKTGEVKETLMKLTEIRR